MARLDYFYARKLYVLPQIADIELGEKLPHADSNQRLYPAKCGEPILPLLSSG